MGENSMGKTPHEIALWETFAASVRQSKTADDCLRACDAYARADKNRGSRVYNRAKKVMELMGYFDDPIWRSKGFGTMGLKMRGRFYDEFMRLRAEDIPTVKIGLLNEMTRRVTIKSILLANAPFTRAREDHSDTMSDNSSEQPRKKFRDEDSDNELPASSLSVVEMAISNPKLIDEVEKSNKARLLADRMQDASFASLAEDVQQAMKDEWLALLC